jgi:precorrin-2 dehydrogenase/sirohydrochlorin ferrochelatase
MHATDESPETTGGRPLYPVALDLNGRTCLVVGGGAVALRKVRGLLAVGADVRVIARDAVEMPAGARVHLRGFEDGDIDGNTFVVAATADRELNARIARLARERGVWVNVADDPAAGDVILPAVARRGALQIAVSTGGASPALARRLRERLEDEFGPEYGDLVALLARLRDEWEPRAIAAGVPPAARHAAWHAVLDLPLVSLLADGRAPRAEEQARDALERVLAEHAG